MFYVTNDVVGEGPVTVAEGHTAHEIQACVPHSNAQLLTMAWNGSLALPGLPILWPMYSAYQACG